MTTIANFEDVRLLEHIKTSGLLTSFTVANGNEPATGKIDITKLAKNKQGILIRKTGGDSFGKPYQGITEYPMGIFVYSKASDSDLKDANGLAIDIWKWLIDNYQSSDECIMAISTRGVAPPVDLEDSRAVFEIPLTVKFNI